MTYLLNGLAIYRDASIREGFPVRPVAAEAARTGDLLFWPGHIGLYPSATDGTCTPRASPEASWKIFPSSGRIRTTGTILARSITAWGSVF